MTDAISIHGLRKRFGETTVLDGLDLDVRAGSVFALLGPNGAGKTTLVNILCTLVQPDAGSVRVAGFDTATQRAEVQHRISLTGQAAAVDGRLTGRENLELVAALRGLRGQQARRRTDELLERFDLVAAGRRASSTYSGGMRRRLDLALGLVVPPQVMFLDEPTTGLDTRSRRELWDVVRGLAADGTTVFLTTQYLEEADQLADRVAVLHGGRIVADGHPHELKRRIGDELVEVTDATGTQIAQVASDGTLAGLAAAVRRLQSDGISEGSVQLRRPSLDDVFLALTGDSAPLTTTATATGRN
ncbi:ABC-2 type transport system ATP-binding protein [Diaminobutyricimonas aerilata]|uniref:ABC-2 type transport system ATP-binding protein n=1 Tax=Diaminobutyricimonas aerilata TaxID=1162967 RepID=A0A2M9CI82_9MICO|nr:ATP-binding cassette domain-containing protein [Diaminobutyricimonas aerilata]PJJ71598.1 ABC-2 type transport system ATP-binding protein [Diaminobutyricimonas aerilata]